MRIQLNISRKLPFLILCAALCAFAARNAAPVGATESGRSAVQVIRDIRVIGEGDDAQVLISADRPLAYTFYTVANPPKGVVDLAQVEPGPFGNPMEINSGNIKRITATSVGEGDAVMTRVEIFLTRNAEMTAAIDSVDKRNLRLAFAPAPRKVSVDGADASSQVSASTGQPMVPSQPAESSAKPAEVAQTKGTSSGPGVINAIVSRKDFLEIQIGGEVSDFKTFRLAKPDRLVVDIFGVRAAMAQKILPVDSFGIDTVRVGAYPDKVRLVFDASGNALPNFTVEKTSSGLSLIPSVNVPEKSKALPESAPPQAKPMDSAPPQLVAERDVPSVKAKSPQQGGVAEVESIEFKVVDNVSRIAIRTSGPCEVGKPVMSPEGLTLNLKDCILPRKWQRHLDTSAFPSVVRRITPYQIKVKGRNDVKLQISLRQQTSHELRREGDVVYLDLKNPAGMEAQRMVEELAPKTETERVPSQTSAKAVQPSVPAQLPEGRKVYTGRRVTLEFSDADIRKIFQLIAEVSNLNFIVGDDVTGTITLKLVNVPWDQALDVILENKGLGMQRDGNIVQIRPKAKIQTLADEEQKMRKAREQAMELKTEVFDINFAAVNDVMNQFNSLKSERGLISIDSRTNRVIVKDIQPNIDDMRRLLKDLDTPEKQVMIEARIVEVETSVSRELGIQWGLHAKDANVLGITDVDTGFGGILSGTPPLIGTVAGGGTFGPGLATGITFGKLLGGSNQSLDMKLSALATRGSAKIISTPKVVTLNNKAAKISQGQSIPYSTVSAEGTKTEFVEAALTLEVTPHITSTGGVIMKIKATNNSAGTPIGSGAPPINKKEATTELLVNNGETTVIGGIYIDQDQDSDTGVPFLKDIPLLGHLFKSSAKKKLKTELLIFITPKIVSS